MHCYFFLVSSWREADVLFAAHFM
uniref:Uncharacterized protein n=1 Tax=Musa acuminata subsp. malaccensis TaxID=214687 RepID=A0A804HXN4_MUSAM